MKTATMFIFAVTGVVSLSVLLDCASAATPLCPHCVCPPSYSPVCGYRKSTRSTRGFQSRCVLECTNKCRSKKYEFVFNGRCGKWSPSTTTQAPRTLSTEARVVTEDSMPASTMESQDEKTEELPLEPTSE